MISDQERNANVLLNTCKDVGLAINTGKIKYVVVGRMADEHIRISSNSNEKSKSI